MWDAVLNAAHERGPYEHPLTRNARDLALCRTSYKNEAGYTTFLVPKLEKWFNVHAQVNACHISGIRLRYDLLLIPKTEEIKTICKFPWLVVEVKFNLYIRDRKSIAQTYWQALAYRSSFTADRRFNLGDGIAKSRPPAVCVCSDLLVNVGQHRLHDLDWVSRDFGRQGVYSLLVDGESLLCFTNHGPVFLLGPPLRYSKAARPDSYTKQKFAGGAEDFDMIKFLVDGGDVLELTDEVYKAALLPPQYPENFQNPNP